MGLKRIQKAFGNILGIFWLNFRRFRQMLMLALRKPTKSGAKLGIACCILITLCIFTFVDPASGLKTFTFKIAYVRSQGHENTTRSNHFRVPSVKWRPFKNHTLFREKSPSLLLSIPPGLGTNEACDICFLKASVAPPLLGDANRFVGVEK